MRIYFSSSIIGGILLGLISYSFYYAKRMSYFSSDPKACVNYHIMQPQYDSWQKGSIIPLLLVYSVTFPVGQSLNG